MNLSDFSLAELYGLFLQYCETEQVINLRKTCKQLYHKIPATWEISELTLHDEQSLKHLTTCRFLNRLCIMFHSAQTLSLEYRLRNMVDLTLTKMVDLHTLIFDPKLTQLRQIFIHHAKKLTTLNIPREFVHIRMIYLSYVDLTEFVIHCTWTQLQIITLIAIPRLCQLSIPKECTRINYINLSKSGIQDLYLYPVFNEMITLQATEVMSPITIHTHRQNIEFIQATFAFHIQLLKENLI